MFRESGIASFFVVLTALLCTKHIAAGRHLNVSVPRWVESGTDEVYLDCEYNYTFQEDNFVLKWFVNQESESVYTWIPSINIKTVRHDYEEFVDNNYTLEKGDKYTKHRAILLLNPTPKLSGNYSCFVNSDSDGGEGIAEMTVFAPAKRINLTYVQIRESNSINVTCEIDGVSPRPEVEIYHFSEEEDSDSENESVPEKQVLDTKVDYEIKDTEENVYRLRISSLISIYELDDDDDTIFYCHISIDEDIYEDRKQVTYHPGLFITTTSCEGKNGNCDDSETTTASFENGTLVTNSNCEDQIGNCDESESSTIDNDKEIVAMEKQRKGKNQLASTISLSSYLILISFALLW